MKKLLLPLSALLALGACQSKDESSVLAPVESNSIASSQLVASGFARMTVAGRADSVNALVVECDSATKAHGGKLKVGKTELPERNGKFLLPIPDLDDFCGAQITFTITTTAGTFTDTLKIKGNACDDTTSKHIPVTPLDSSIVFDFQDTGRVIHDKSGRFTANTSNALWNSESGSSFSLNATNISGANFGSLFKDGAKEGSIEFQFKPSASFASIPARTLFGDDGSRIHIGWAQGQLFFQKNHDNIHRFVATDTGMLKDTAWHTIQATWGPQGMTLALDKKLVAWSNDVSAYHAGPTGAPFGNELKIGTKSWCCMEPERITNDLSPSGSYRFLKLGFKQPHVWEDGLAHACVERSHTAIPSCGVTSPSYVAFPIW